MMGKTSATVGPHIASDANIFSGRDTPPIGSLETTGATSMTFESMKALHSENADLKQRIVALQEENEKLRTVAGPYFNFTDSGQVPLGVEHPTEIQLKEILQAFEPDKKAFEDLCSEIDAIRNTAQTTMESIGKEGITVDYLSAELTKAGGLEERFANAAKKYRQQHALIEDWLEKLHNLIGRANNSKVHDACLVTISKRNYIPLEFLKQNDKNYAKTLKACEAERGTIKTKLDRVIRRFENARDHINAIGGHIESSSIIGYYFTKNRLNWQKTDFDPLPEPSQTK